MHRWEVSVKIINLLFSFIFHVASQAKMYTKYFNMKTKPHKTIAQEINIQMLDGTTVEK